MAPFTGFRWPTPGPGRPGAWVDAPDGRTEHGVHACRARDLAFWLEAELWRTELADPVAEGQRQVIAGRGRLVERVTPWDEAMARSFAEACIWRSRDRSVVALRRATHHEAAERLGRCAGLDELHAAASGLGGRRDLAAALAGYIAEALDFLRAGDAACAAYIAARSAVVAEGGQESEFGAERESQGTWLAERLGLSRADGQV